MDGSCVASSADQVGIFFAEEPMAGGIHYWQSVVLGGVPGRAGGIFSRDFASRDATPRPVLKGGCPGCHALSRDGARMVVGRDDEDGDDERLDCSMSLVDPGTGQTLSDLLRDRSPGALNPLGQVGSFATFTHDHAKMIFGLLFDTQGMPPLSTSPPPVSALDSLLVHDGNDGKPLARIDLAIPVAQPDLSRDDSTLVFVSPGGFFPLFDRFPDDMHFRDGSLFTASFDAATNAIGTPAPLLQAKPGQSFYYPSFSPDKGFVVFNAIANAGPNDDVYYNRRARVALLEYPPGPDPRPIELPALNAMAQGDSLTNSWPKWSPFVQKYQGHKVLWVTFSSNRDYGLHVRNGGLDNCYPPGSPKVDTPVIDQQGTALVTRCKQPQIWMAAIIVDSGGENGPLRDRSFPAFWLPFQDVNSHNHTAQWVEKIVDPLPPVTPPVPPIL